MMSNNHDQQENSEGLQVESKTALQRFPNGKSESCEETLLSAETIAARTQFEGSAKRVQNIIGCTIIGSQVGCSNPSMIKSTADKLASKTASRTFEPVDNIGPETIGFIDTSSYKQLDDIAKKEQVLILHIHGYPGTGKSEIARKLASTFPASDCYIKWHIECVDKSQDVSTELISLLKALKESDIVPAATNNAENNLQINKSKPFVDLLRRAGRPTLILIEDPPASDSDLLREFLQWVDRFGDSMTAPFHVYITMRKNEFATTRDHLKMLKCYRDHQVDGFSKDEAMKMLFSDVDTASYEEREAAAEVIATLSGSPQALVAAKAYCVNTLSSYQQYLKYLLSPELESQVLKTEMHHLKDIYGPNVKHLFKSMELLLKPKTTDKDEIPNIIWKVMTTLCFLHHGYVPQQLVGRIAQKGLEEPGSSTENRHYRNVPTSGSVVTRLESYGICKVMEKGNYPKCTLTFHEVVFRAVRMSVKSDYNSYVSNLKHAIFSISGIVNKDLRKSVDNIFMNELAPQIASAISHAKNTFDIGAIEDLAEEFLLQMCICHLQETIGIVKSLGVLSLKKQAEDYLSDAVSIVLKTVARLTDTQFDPTVMQHSQNHSAEEVATKIVNASIQAGQSLPPHLLDEYMSLVLQMKLPKLDFLERRTENVDAVRQIKEATEKHVGLNLALLVQLRKSQDIFLSESSHCAVFFCERLSSILHTMGRVLLYYNIRITDDMRRKFMWFSKLSHTISVKCFAETHIRILFERLTSVSMVPIMLKGLNYCSPEEKKATLLEANTILENLICVSEESQDTNFYEHGHIKEVDGTVYDQMILHRFMMRVKTKLMAMAEKEDERFVADSEKIYHKLYKLATENITWIMAPKCLVYCGKYDACRGRYAQAVGCFTGAIKAGIKQSNNLFAWASYNYARAVLAGNLIEHYEAVAAKCSEALKSSDDTDEDLIKYLNNCLQSLQSGQAIYGDAAKTGFLDSEPPPKKIRKDFN